MSLVDRWDEDKKPLQPIKNENLVCKDCINVLSDYEIVNCKIYETKPVSVLKGGTCDAKETK